MNEQQTTSISRKRILGSAIFGTFIAWIANYATENAIGEVYSIYKNKDLYDVIIQFRTSEFGFGVIAFICVAIGCLVGSIAATFLSRGKTILPSIIMGVFEILQGIILLPISILPMLMAKKIVPEDGSIKYYFQSVYSFLFSKEHVMENITAFGVNIPIIFIACIIGYFIAKKIYKPQFDLDFKNNKLTLFGVRWFHYIWISFVLLLYFLSFIQIPVAVVHALTSLLFQLTHPSHWLDFSYFLTNLVINPMLLALATILSIQGFIRFFALMQYGVKSNVFIKVIKVVLLGYLLPNIPEWFSRTIDFLTASYLSGYNVAGHFLLDTCSSIESLKLNVWSNVLVIIATLVLTPIIALVIRVVFWVVFESFFQIKFSSMASIFLAIGGISTILFGIYGLVLDFLILGGYSLMGFFFFPLVIVLVPFYAIFKLNYWLPYLITYGGTIFTLLIFSLSFSDTSSQKNYSEEGKLKLEQDY